MRIFQLAKELNVDSQEIIDALEDMDIQVKSNLTALDDDLIGELRELFKPRPTPSRSAKDDAVARALAERTARERAAEEARRREEERKEQARQEALRRAAKKRESLAKSQREAEEAKRAETEAAQQAQAEAVARAQAASEPAAPDQAVAEEIAETPVAEAAAPESAGAEAPVEDAAAPEAEAPAATSAAREDKPAPAEARAESPRKPEPAASSRSSLGKAVIAPPPSTAKERAEMLGTRLSDPRVAGRHAQPTPARPAPPPGPGPRGGAGPRRGPGGPPGSAGGAFGDMTGGRKKRKKGRKGDKKQDRRPVAEARPEPVLDPVGEIKISDGITVKDIAERMDRKAKDVIAKLFLEKKMIVTINHALDEDTAAWVVEAFGGNPDLVAVEDEAIAAVGAPEAPEGMEIEESVGVGELRAPVVTMMGHVDHGKTSLLDAIKETRIAEREAGGITQHIGAYKVQKEYEGKDREIVFLDTPGHAAFTLMRARGATVTDIIVLVVAADDGVMPQTIEAINHARSANAPIIVAVNKVDKDGALPDRVLQQLTEHQILVEEYGGETVACKVSAKTHEGLDHLLEMILLTADLQEWRAHPERPASGTVLEAQLDKSRGAVATVLVQNGTLRVGDVFVVGSTLGRVRALIDERDRRLEEAGPSTPVQIMGLDNVPEAGDGLQVFPNEQKARQIALYRQSKLREEKVASTRKMPTLELLAQQISEGDMSELPVIVKGDVQGSVEVLRKALTDLSTDEVQVKVIHGATGAITETDVLLAQAGKAIIVGFNVRPQRGVKELAEREGVDIRLHTVIYKVTDEIKAAMLATLSPVEKEVYLGRAEVLETFKVPKVGIIAGSKVVDGLIRRDAQVRLLRDNIVIHEGKVGSLRRFKDDAKEVRSGFECGIGIERYNDVKPGDEIEAFVIELKQRESLETAESKES